VRSPAAAAAAPPPASAPGSALAGPAPPAWLGDALAALVTRAAQLGLAGTEEPAAPGEEGWADLESRARNGGDAASAAAGRRWRSAFASLYARLARHLAGLSGLHATAVAPGGRAELLPTIRAMSCRRGLRCDCLASLIAA
jgi:hypothetical protein